MKKIVFLLLLLQLLSFAADSNEVIIEKLKKNDETVTLAVYQDVTTSIKNDKLPFSEAYNNILILVQYCGQTKKITDEIFKLLDLMNQVYKKDDEHFEIVKIQATVCDITKTYNDKTNRICLEYRKLLFEKKQKLMLADESNNLIIAEYYITTKDYKVASSFLNNIIKSKYKFDDVISKETKIEYSQIRCKALDSLIFITPKDKIQYLRLPLEYYDYITKMNYFGYDKELFKDTFINVEYLSTIFNWLSGEYSKTDDPKVKKVLVDCMKMIANKDPILLKLFNSFKIDEAK